MKPGKHQRSKQTCQDLGWKVRDGAQSFVLSSYTMHDYVTNTFLLVSSSVRSKQLLCFVHCQGARVKNAVHMRVFSASGAYLPLKLYAMTKQTRFRLRNSKK